MKIMERFKRCRNHELWISGIATCASDTVFRVHFSAIFYHELYMQRLISAYSSVSRSPGRGPVSGPGINCTGPREA